LHATSTRRGIRSRSSYSVSLAGHGGACNPLRCDHPRGSLSQAQVRGRLSPLPHAGTALAVVLVGPRAALALFLEQPRELRLLAGRIWEGQLLSSNWVMRVRR